MPRRTTPVAERSALETVERAINGRWAGSVKRASDPSLAITRIPTGILSVDVALGGGIARGRHTEIYGPYSVGKTMLMYRMIAEAQRLGMECAFGDVEGSFNEPFARHCGVDTERLLFLERANGNILVGILETLVRSGTVQLCVLDSIAALLPKKEEDSDIEAGSYGTAQAQLMSAALRRLTTANKSDTALVYLNQLRDNLGITFGKKTTTTGGRAMGFYAGTRIEMVRTENIKKARKRIDTKGDEKIVQVVTGHRVLVRIDKDKTGGARQASETTFVMDYDTSLVDPIEDLLYLGRVYGLIKKNGTSWWVDGYDDERSVGRNRFYRWLKRNTTVCEWLDTTIREKAAAVDLLVPIDDDSEDDSGGD